MDATISPILSRVEAHLAPWPTSGNLLEHAQEEGKGRSQSQRVPSATAARRTFDRRRHTRPSRPLAAPPSPAEAKERASASLEQAQQAQPPRRLSHASASKRGKERRPTIADLICDTASSVDDGTLSAARQVL
jgi:hypothetical protein